MIETIAEYEERLKEIKSSINQDINTLGFCMLDKNSITWDQLVDLAIEYKFKYPLDTDNVIKITRVDK